MLSCESNPIVPLNYSGKSIGSSITFSLPEASLVTVVVQNPLGDLVRTLVSEMKPAGVHTIVWDRRNDDGEIVKPGIFFATFKAGFFTDTVIIKIAG